MNQIKTLPKEVVDRIAAGEVVQRPCSVAKELVENSLDARSLSIDVLAEKGGLTLIQITDDGCGMSKEDLELAAERFATSKLNTFEDLKTIRTFGFRGEALASASMVSMLSIQSRRASDEVAYKCSYKDGVVFPGSLKPAAGGQGTIVKVEDLFYNVPARKRSFKRDSEEYLKILDVMQRYSIHRAGDGVGFTCRKKSAACGADLNTKSLSAVQSIMRKRKVDFDAIVSKKVSEEERIQARKEAIGHVYGSDLSRELLPIECGEGDVEAVSILALNALNSGDNQEVARDMAEMEASALSTSSSKTTSRFTFAYRCTGLATNASYCVKNNSSAFVFFINDRLVECSGLRRAIEVVYNDVLPQRGKPFVYLSLELPGPHVDVNVHPTKKEVAFLHEDRLCDALAMAMRKCLSSATASRTFYAQAVLPTKREEARDLKRIQKMQGLSDTQTKGGGSSGALSSINKRKEEDDDDAFVDKSAPSLNKFSADAQPFKKQKKAYDPKSLVRTSSAAPTGALEPFLRSTQPPTQAQAQTQSQSSDKSNTSQSDDGDEGDDAPVSHTQSCELFVGSSSSSSSVSAPTIDLSIPGAFASAALCRCREFTTSDLIKAAKTSAEDNSETVKKIIRPKRHPPTPCAYASILALRSDVSNRADSELGLKLRNATFVGCISRQRSLMQWGLELLMINHVELAKELFFQLALMRFGGIVQAVVGSEGDGDGDGGEGGIDVKMCIAQALKSDGDGGGSEMDEKEIEKSASDMVQCLSDQADMLREYFSISLVVKGGGKGKGKSKSKSTELNLTGLPVLLDGHSPSPHALPVFLMRLASAVDYTEERQCFEGVCTELGAFYSEVPEVACVDEKENENGKAMENSQEICTPLLSQSSTSSSNTNSSGNTNGNSNSNLVFLEDEGNRLVKHTIFPAISYLLVPPREFVTDGTVTRMALLSSLYKVFERC